MQGIRLPRTIPLDRFSPAQLRVKRYGLQTTAPEELLQDPLCTEMEAFESWARQPLRMDRPSAYLSCCTETFDKNAEVVYLALGFMKNVIKVTPTNPTHACSSHQLVSLCLLSASL